jgi:hypothetical protein
MNAYLRAAEKFPGIRDQILERASKRPEWAGKAAVLQKLRTGMEKLAARGGERDKPGRLERARDVLGQFKGDNPETPDVNEAWEPVPEPPKRGKGRE